ncbi:hypothetical protein Gotri_011608 [Gossypium trilobum]|uniref:Uncharacterized protein n=1 Tax=Gossypium trilobum TaxID=34281 RepID=A0A7J9EUC4_9ROSI|nr:hypothetical protein [Gossypium trilobum]
MKVREVEVENLNNSFQTCVFLFGHRLKNEIAHLLAIEVERDRLRYSFARNEMSSLENQRNQRT